MNLATGKTNGAPSWLRVDVGSAELACLAFGPSDGPLVLLLHGFPDCARSWRHTWGPLADAGYRVVAPTLRGYAPSSLARDGRYDGATLGRDVLALIERLGQGPARVVGHDWGALAAYAAAALAPERLSHLCTVAVPHPAAAGLGWVRPAQLRRSWYMFYFQLRGLAERRVSADHLAFIDRLWRDWSPGWQQPPDEMEAVKAALRPPEHLGAALGYYRAMLHPRAFFDENRLLLRPAQVPALYVHGVDDGCMGVELVDGVERAYRRGVRVERIAGAGHFCHLEKPERFNPLLLDFLRS
jgi:pimeloyl-ACP methyl ester carboxylesterase